ncbi:MAG: leucine-rich repeat domain-containing protein [Patescibacteria group bacterium]
MKLKINNRQSVYLPILGAVLLLTFGGCSLWPGNDQGRGNDVQNGNQPGVRNDEINTNTNANTSGSTNNQPAENTGGGIIKESGATIDLSGKGLTEFPKDILSRPGVKKLILSNNRIKSLPSEIGELTDIEELYLDGNELTGALPGEIRKMSELKILDAHNNGLTGIPAEIGQLKNLQVINFSGNKIDTMPDEIGNIKGNLEVLNISGNGYSSDAIRKIEDMLPDTQVIF